MTQVAQPLSLSPGCPETQPLPEKSLQKTTMEKAKSDGHCCLTMGKECGCRSWVKAKSQTLRPQLQTLGCREVSSEEVKGRQGTFWRHRGLY